MVFEALFVKVCPCRCPDCLPELLRADPARGGAHLGGQCEIDTVGEGDTARFRVGVGDFERCGRVGIDEQGNLVRREGMGTAAAAKQTGEEGIGRASLCAASRWGVSMRHVC